MRRRGDVLSILTSVAIMLATAGTSLGDSFPWRTFDRKPIEWFQSEEASQRAANVLSHQAETGSWPSNIDTSAAPRSSDQGQLRGTFDNGATVGEIRFLARVSRATGGEGYRDACLRGIDHILKAQYANGGWPQYDPPGKGYARHITFNDNAMVNLMRLLRDVADEEDFAFVGETRRQAARQAFDRGIGCILACQVMVDGKRTVWCAQHDEQTLEPRPARAFEPASLSGHESAGLLLLLMSLEKPSPEVRRAIEDGVDWFARSAIEGIRVERTAEDTVVVEDAGAPALWARFYEIGTNRPIFCGRDSVIRSALAEIEHERRMGYAWYGPWGREVARQHARWAERQGKSNGDRQVVEPRKEHKRDGPSRHV